MFLFHTLHSFKILIDLINISQKEHNLELQSCPAKVRIFFVACFYTETEGFFLYECYLSRWLYFISYQVTYLRMFVNDTNINYAHVLYILANQSGL
jgi:hypothetical protein